MLSIFIIRTTKNCKYTWRCISTTTCFRLLPSQTLPFSTKPSLQVHTGVPVTLLHVAFWSHMLSSVHAKNSVKEVTNNLFESRDCLHAGKENSFYFSHPNYYFLLLDFC